MRFLIISLVAILLLSTMVVHSAAEEFTFDVQNDLTSESTEIKSFTNSIPESIRDKITDIDVNNADEAAQKYDFHFFLEEILTSVKDACPSALSLFSALVASVILISIFEKLSQTIDLTGCSKSFHFCSALCIALSLYAIKGSSFNVALTLLKSISSIMTVFVPVMEAVYISSGNTSLAAVSTTSITLILTIVEALYSKILAPAVSVSFVFAAISSATDNNGIKYLSKTLRMLITMAIVFTMSMISIILSLQSGVAASADKFSARAIKFALGSYIPLVGGSISESLSSLTSSISLIKQLAGTTGIVVLSLLIIPPLITLTLTRFAIYLSSAVSGMLGCERAHNLLDDMGGNYTMLICITLSASFTFIYALALFCKASVAFG